MLIVSIFHRNRAEISVFTKATPFSIVFILLKGVSGRIGKKHLTNHKILIESKFNQNRTNIMASTNEKPFKGILPSKGFKKIRERPINGEM